jgi:hypothetical protein
MSDEGLGLAVLLGLYALSKLGAPPGAPPGPPAPPPVIPPVVPPVIPPGVPGFLHPLERLEILEGVEDPF